MNERLGRCAAMSMGIEWHDLQPLLTWDKACRRAKDIPLKNRRLNASPKMGGQGEDHG